MYLKIHDMQTGYRAILDAVIQNGRHAAPRRMPIKEIIGAHIELTDPTAALPSACGRKINPAIAAVEAAQLISGEAWPQLTMNVSKNFKTFSNGQVLHGAYGPRIRSQIPHVLEVLNRDRDSRQAIVTIFDPMYDQQPGILDVPCTMSLQFFIREGKLEMVTHMRSNDVWWGVAYDFFQFTQLQIAVAWCLDVELGSYHHLVGSLHMYDRDIPASIGVRVTRPLRVVDRPYAGPMTADRRWNDYRQAASELLAGDSYDKVLLSRSWYRRTLSKYER